MMMGEHRTTHVGHGMHGTHTGWQAGEHTNNKHECSQPTHRIEQNRTTGEGTDPSRGWTGHGGTSVDTW